MDMEYVQLSIRGHGLDLAVDAGCVVIKAGIEAAAAGVTVGARLASINGRSIEDGRAYNHYLSTLKDGTTIVAGLVRSARLVRMIFAKRHVMDSSTEMRCLVRELCEVNGQPQRADATVSIAAGQYELPSVLHSDGANLTLPSSSTE
jgi:hypothetical protein